jgi:hypothetical protein
MKTLTMPSACEFSAGAEVAAPPIDAHGLQPVDGENQRWWIALSVPRTARSKALVPRRGVAAGADVAVPPSESQPDHCPPTS